MNKCYNFVNSQESQEADLYISGDIIDNDTKELYRYWGIEGGTAPGDFKKSLDECAGKTLNVYIDSYGGDVIAASAIYTMLREYKGQKIVKVSSIAASAASVIAMAGDKLLMSPTAFLMIHDPSTLVWGNITEIKQTLDALRTIKEGIINAYEKKSNLSRDKIANLMTNETWLDYNDACEYGFCDGEIESKSNIFDKSFLNNIKNRQMAIYNSIKKPINTNKPNEPIEQQPTNENLEEKEKMRMKIELYKMRCSVQNKSIH